MTAYLGEWSAAEQHEHRHRPPQAGEGQRACWWRWSPAPPAAGPTGKTPASHPHLCEVPKRVGKNTANKIQTAFKHIEIQLKLLWVQVKQSPINQVMSHYLFLSHEGQLNAGCHIIRSILRWCQSQRNETLQCKPWESDEEVRVQRSCPKLVAQPQIALTDFVAATSFSQEVHLIEQSKW